MRSLPKVIKPAGLVASQEVYQIPDNAPMPPPLAEDCEGEASPQSPPEAPQEQESQEERERRWEEERKKREEFLETQARLKADEAARQILLGAEAERARMLAEAEIEASGLREEAKRAAYEAVYQEKRQIIEGRLLELDRLMERLQADQSEFLRQYEEGLSALALEIAQKLLDESILEHKELMKPLVQKAVSTVKNADWISVQVSDRLPGRAEELKAELAGRPGFPPVDVIAADAGPGSCVVHTPEGIVDASVPVQLENLKGLFEGR